MSETGDARPTAILLARSAIAAAPLAEMARLTSQLMKTGLLHKAVFALSEQGVPTFRDVVLELQREGIRDVLILPLLVPLEANYGSWITRSLQRWRTESDGLSWPSFRVGRGLSEAQELGAFLTPMLDSALKALPVGESSKVLVDGSILSDKKYRVLVCSGGPCMQAGAASVWAHLRKRQVELNLADENGGMRSTKTSCLGPCALAPVVQVYPEAVFYGGVTERAVDRIVKQHLIAGEVVTAFVYEPWPGKQVLRATSDKSTA